MTPEYAWPGCKQADVCEFCIRAVRKIGRDRRDMYQLVAFKPIEEAGSVISKAKLLSEVGATREARDSGCDALQYAVALLSNT